MHADKRKEKIKGTGAMSKSAVMGLLACRGRKGEDGPVSQVVTRVVASTKAVDLVPHITASTSVRTRTAIRADS